MSSQKISCILFEVSILLSINYIFHSTTFTNVDLFGFITATITTKKVPFFHKKSVYPIYLFVYPTTTSR